MTAARILIVEDDRIVARDIEQQLLRLGYVVTGITARGDAALALATETRTDLVLMDVRVQGPMDGIDAARQIRAACQIPVVFLTAYADEDTLRRASAAEPFGYVLKPFEDAQLHTVIGMALYKHASEQRLRASEQRYAVTLASIGDAVISTDAQLAVTFLNPAAERLTGWVAAEAQGQPLAAVFALRDRAGLDEVAQVLASGAARTRTGASTLCRRDGVSFVIDETIAPMLDARGTASGVVLVFRDVSARRHAEEAQALAEAELRWRTITESLPHMIWTALPSGESDFFSPQCYAYLGLPDGAIEGNGRWLDILHPDDRDRSAAAWEHARLNGLRYETQYRLRRHDGVYRWFHNVGVPLFDAAGRPTKWFGTSTDITERKEAEEAMVVARNAAEQANRAKNQFLANMSHELRTPLNGILGYAQILRRDGGLNPRQQDGINVIEQSGDYLLTLINDILDFSRIEARKMTLEVAEFRLERFLTVITEIMRMRAVEKGITLSCTQAGPLPQVIRADERRLRQVLLNLLANAVRFTDAGEVRLTVTFTAPTTLRFDIEDTGIGIAPAALETIFEPFEQAGTAGRRSGGAGLGLAISRQLVRLMGADIRVESVEHVGSRFWFALDVAVVQGSSGVIAAPAPARAGGRRRAGQPPGGRGHARRTGFHYGRSRRWRSGAGLHRCGRPGCAHRPGADGCRYAGHGWRGSDRTDQGRAVGVHSRHCRVGECIGPQPRTVPGGRRRRLPRQAAQPGPAAGAGRASAGPAPDRGARSGHGGSAAGVPARRRDRCAAPPGFAGQYARPGPACRLPCRTRCALRAVRAAAAGAGGGFSVEGSPAADRNDQGWRWRMTDPHLAPRPATILVVDDTPTNLRVVVECLEGLGHTVVIAQDGEEGLQRAAFVQPDLILLDVLMPGVDGLETCRRLKSQAATQAIPVIFMTALTGLDDKIAGFQAGAVDYVTKPLEVNELAARIATHLQLHALQRLQARQNARLQHEVRERRRAEAELVASIDGVRNVSNAIAHDLRTPLASLRARLESVLIRALPPEDVLQEVEAALGDVDGVIDIFNALMRLAELDAGVRRSGFVAFDLDRVAGDAVEFYLPVAELRGIRLVLEPGGCLPAEGDPQLLAQAVGNLLDNAIKFADAGSTVTVAAYRAGAHLALAVRDRGPGIPDADKAKVVQRFYRGDRSRATPGVGLGLALVVAVAQLHRGRLDLADNHPGLAATLFVPGR
jgi:PAS domain S-box-containing protein